MFSFILGEFIQVELLFLLRNYQNVIHRGCTMLYSYHQYRMRFLLSHHLLQHFVLSFSLIIAILRDVKWYLIVFKPMCLGFFGGGLFFLNSIFSLKEMAAL